MGEWVQEAGCLRVDVAVGAPVDGEWDIVKGV